MALPGSELFPGPTVAGLLPGIRPESRPGRPGLMLLLGAAATVALIIVALTNAAGLGAAGDDAQVLVSTAASSIALLLMARRPAPSLLRYRPLALAIALAGLGIAAVDAGSGDSPAGLIANLSFVASCSLAMACIVPALYRHLDGRTAASAGLDGGIMLLAGTTLLITLWRTAPDTVAGPADFVMPVLASALFASAGVAAIAALSMRIAPSFRGVWCGIVGVSTLGLCWVIWIDRALHGLGRGPIVGAFFSIGIFIVTYAWMTWSEEIGGGQLYARVSRSLADWLPIAAILLCVAVAAAPHGRVEGLDPAPIGTATVIMLTIARQRLLILSERRASRHLAREVEERAQTMLSLGRLEQAESLEATARRICGEALRLDAIEAAGVYTFGPNGAVVPLALAGIRRQDEVIGEPIEIRRATHIQAFAAQGPWVDALDIEHLIAASPLVGEAFAPMRWDDRVVGVVAVGTSSREEARRLLERLSTLTEFGVVSAALLGPTLAEHSRLDGIRSLLDDVIGRHAFTPVFQPVVRLIDGHIVGYEALTRFADGTRPDKRFMEAHTAGMSVRLEMACLGDQLEAASWLPDGIWVSLNVSPALATAVIPLVSALERADRDVVLEITEHVEIADYGLLLHALDLVRGQARLAVDDAGAGYAGLRHILELKPQFVKLDLSLVRNIDTDPARQAMVAGMAHFAANSACELIAEGIETKQELAELIRLGIPLGQGYLYGKPAPIG
jgi:EAL domain-containing protein (putative c-di-GMP-specific phosphodiesterase class I)